MRKKIVAVIAVLAALAMCLTACTDNTVSPTANASDPTPTAAEGNSDSTPAPTEKPSDPVTEPDPEPPVIVIPDDFAGLSSAPSKFDVKVAAKDATEIKCSGTTVEINGAGASFESGKITISVPGCYVISGTLDNGSVYVSVDKTEKVHLILNGANISCSTGPAIYIDGADKVSVTLADGTDNSLFDGKVYSDGNACLYSKDDLTINGNGSLTVNASCNNGIGCKNDLTIISGTINVTAVTNGIKGNDSVSIFGGKITVKAGKDGIKADTLDDTKKGFVFIAGGDITITSGDDGIQAETSLGIIGGSVTFKATDKKTNCKTYKYKADGTVK